MILGAILYFLNPFDIVPDALPFIGYIDDVTILGWVISSLRSDIEDFRRWEIEQAVKEELTRE